MKNRIVYAAYGVLATLLGVAAGHLVAGFSDPASSPVLAVGSTVIDLTPTPLKEWAVQHFGTNDKPILIGSVFAGVLVLAAVAGALSRRRFLVGGGLLALLVAMAGAAALNRPTAGVTAVLPALVAGVVGIAALAWLVRRTGSRDGREPGLDKLDQRAATDAAPSRRGILVGVGVMAVAAGAMGYAGRQVAAARGKIKDFALPKPASPAPALPEGLEATHPGIAPFRTPSNDFYRVDTRLTLPVIDLDVWRLTIDGDVEDQLTFSLDDLLGMELIERDITLTCVSNDIGGPYVGATRFTGVRLTDLLERAGVGGTADQILSTDVDGMTISTPLDLATDGRDAMIAIAMDGKPLPREHGYPARMVVPGLYGFISATKWITRMTLTTYAEKEAYWTPRGWATQAPIKLASRIDIPRDGEELDTGEVIVGGIAWAHDDDGVGRVQVRIDDRPWQDATLGPSGGPAYWRQWFMRWDAPKGEHRIRVRVVGKNGDVQTSKPAEPAPDGASGHHEVTVSVV
jgi:DMSO/TMAO reductase YedYZ molybdopterin-dependent catalytic subunit